MTDTYKPSPPSPEDIQRAIDGGEGRRRHTIISEKVLLMANDAAFFATLIETDPCFADWDVAAVSRLRDASGLIHAAYQTLHAKSP